MFKDNLFSEVSKLSPRLVHVKHKTLFDIGPNINDTFSGREREDISVQTKTGRWGHSIPKRGQISKTKKYYFW